MLKTHDSVLVACWGVKAYDSIKMGFLCKIRTQSVKSGGVLKAQYEHIAKTINHSYFTTEVLGTALYESIECESEN